MKWNEIIGQTRVKSLLQKAIINNKVPHAYCFLGQEGIGKEAIAIYFAKVVNCESPIISPDSIEACEVCSSCIAASTLQHPNIKLVFSIPTGKGTASGSDSPIAKLSSEQINQIQEQIAMKSKNPYHKISISGANQIKIASIREIKSNLILTASAQGRRCIIIFQADEMTTEAANAFLKTLEEPHENITIIIITSRQESILPTILSRCQQVQFQMLPYIELAEYICNADDSITKDDANLAASFGQGSMSKAIDFLDENMKQIREDVVDLLRTALKKRIYRVELLKKLEPIFVERDRKKTELILMLLITWLRDTLTIIKLSSEKNIINLDQIEIIKKFAGIFADKNLPKAISVVEKAIEQNRKNASNNLLLINMFLELRKVFLR